jgi:hypothetical protein
MISLKELETINEFEKNHSRCYHKYKKTSKFKIKATQTGLGYNVKVKCCGCKKSKDVTDYDTW